MITPDRWLKDFERQASGRGQAADLKQNAMRLLALDNPLSG
jgi:hypothetical protein